MQRKYSSVAEVLDLYGAVEREESQRLLTDDELEEIISEIVQPDW